MLDNEWSKGSKRMWVIAAIIVVGVIGISSSYWLGADNPVEEVAEEVEEEMVEIELELPKGSMKGKIDMSPKSKEKQAVDNS